MCSLYSVLEAMVQMSKLLLQPPSNQMQVNERWKNRFPFWYCLMHDSRSWYPLASIHWKRFSRRLETFSFLIELLDLQPTKILPFVRSCRIACHGTQHLITLSVWNNYSAGGLWSMAYVYFFLITRGKSFIVITSFTKCPKRKVYAMDRK